MSLFSKIARFASTPQGRRMVEQAKRAASDPENRRKVEQAVRQMRAKKPR